MRPAVVVLGAWLCVACAVSGGPRAQLIGRWQSDREATLAGLETHLTITAEQRQILDELLGQLVLEYTDHTLTSQFEEWTDTGTYRVIDEGPDFVDLRGYDELRGRDVTRRVWVHEDQMWVWVEGIGFYEFFKRLPPDGFDVLAPRSLR